VGAYFRNTSPVISRNELDAMRYLKNQEGREIVLVLNKGQWDSHFSYVSIFTGTNTFLSGQVIMSRHGIDFSEREKVIKDLQNSTNTSGLKQLLSRNNISYLYFYGNYGLKLKPEEVDLSRVFDNHTISIYKVTK
ncbi:MAG: hypothetical protein Q7T54_01045, partial [Candidatus Levybacteria bacterium]|nr:hypothetical protein [Candidatus Levybacteria bacterium]